MVLFFTCSDPKYVVYMGKDKFENEKLIKYAFPEDIWFHVDKFSSAHVYLRLPPGSVELWNIKDKAEAKTRLLDAIKLVPDDIVQEMCQLTKANSIDGCKEATCDMVYTPAINLKKEDRMDVGQVSFKDESQRWIIKNVAKDNYDIARHKLTKESSEMDKAKAIADAKETKAKAAEAKAAAAKEKAEAAKAEAAEAKAAKAKAEEEAGAEANGKKSEMSKEEAEMRAKVEAAEAEYLKEKAQFKNCQQELEDAKTKYEALKAEKENLVKTDTAQAKLLKIDHTMIDQEKTREDVALAKLAKAEKERDVAEAEAAKVRAENEKAMKALAKEQADVQAVQSQLDEADAKLRGGPKVKGLGNMGKKSKSAASARTLSQTVMLVVASAALKQLF